MGRLLYIEASPRKQRSSSIAMAHTLCEEYKKLKPDTDVYTIDLWKMKIPVLDGDILDAKYALLHNVQHTEGQKKAWKLVEDCIEEFKTGDVYVFSLPMWNFGIPYILKHYIDILVQPSYTFTVTSDGKYKGLITGKKAVIICSRGGTYPKGTPGEKFDLQLPYMEEILRFIGFQEIYPIIIEPTLEGREKKEVALQKAKDTVAQIVVKL